MYSKEKVELFLLAVDEGMGVADAADFAGVKRRAARDWTAGSVASTAPDRPVRV